MNTDSNTESRGRGRDALEMGKKPFLPPKLLQRQRCLGLMTKT